MKEETDLSDRPHSSKNAAVGEVDKTKEIVSLVTVDRRILLANLCEPVSLQSLRQRGIQ